MQAHINNFFGTASPQKIDNSYGNQSIATNKESSDKVKPPLPPQQKKSTQRGEQKNSSNRPIERPKAKIKFTEPLKENEELSISSEGLVVKLQDQPEVKETTVNNFEKRREQIKKQSQS